MNFYALKNYPEHYYDLKSKIHKVQNIDKISKSININERCFKYSIYLILYYKCFVKRANNKVN